MHKQRNNAVDVLRVLFALVIVIYHVPYGSLNSTALFPRGYLACEFFFMISGYFTARRAVSCNECGIETEHLGEESFVYVLRKIKSVFLLFVLSYIPSFIISALYSAVLNPLYSLQEALSSLPDAIYELTFITMGGGAGFVANGVSWFFSALFLSTAIVYPLLRKRYDLFVYLIAPLASIFVMGYFSQVYGHLNLWRCSFNGLFYPGMLRALIETSMGAVGYEISRRIGVKVPWGTPVLLYISAMLCMALFSSSLNDFFVLALLFAAVSTTSALDGRFPSFFRFSLERFSISLVLNHIYIFYLLEYINSVPCKFTIYMGSVITVSVGMTALDKHFSGKHKGK